MAPITARHILKLAKLGAYNSVHFFRVDKGFVAQTADVVFGRLEGVGLDARQMVSPPAAVRHLYRRIPLLQSASIDASIYMAKSEKCVAGKTEPHTC